MDAVRPVNQKFPFYVGYGLNNCAFEGLVDEVRMVRRALDPSEFLRFRGEPGAMLIFR